MPWAQPAISLACAFDLLGIAFPSPILLAPVAVLAQQLEAGGVTFYLKDEVLASTFVAVVIDVIEVQHYWIIYPALDTTTTEVGD